MSRFRKRLLWQIIPILLIMLIPAFFIGGYLACREIMDMCIEEQQKDLSHAAALLEWEVTDNPNYEWMLEYWSENAEELNQKIIYDNQTALDEARQRFVTMNPGMDDITLTPEELKSIDAESRDLYAQIELMDMILYYNKMKEIYGLKYVYMVKMLSADEELFLVTGAVDGETRGNGARDIYTIGKRANPNLQYHPVLTKIYSERLRSDELEKKEEEGRTGYDYNEYIPVFTSDGSIYIISFCQYAESISDRITSRIYYMIIILVIVLIIATVLMVLAFYRVLLAPVSLLQQQIRKYTEDKDDSRLVEALSTIVNENEIGQLTKDISRLATELSRHTDEVVKLSAKNERIETELGLARRIQMAALPKEIPVFENNNFEIAAGITPAKEVGGDFYDYFKLDDDHLAIMIADVSGKGVPAAMFMMLSHICIKNMARTISEPDRLLECVNEILLERNEAEMFVTIWFGILEISTGIIKCVNAGHENPAIGTDNEGFKLYTSKHGFVLAGMSGIKYKTETIQMKKGEALFLYTDGVPEATNADRELFGTDRMLTALNKSNGSCDDMIQSVTRDIEQFVGEAAQFDDLTMVCIKYL